MVALKIFRHQEPAFSDLLPWAGLVENGIILLKDGALMASWYFAGPDPMSAPLMERNQLSARINALFARLGTGWMIQVEAIRLPVRQYPAAEDCHFPDPVSAMIDQERRQRFEASNRHYESQYALVLTYRTPDEVPGKLARFMFSNADDTLSFADEQLQHFRQAIAGFEGELSDIFPIRRMITQETEIEGGKRAEFDDLCQFIRFCMTGENHPVRLPTIPFYLDSILAAEFHHGLAPIVENRFIATVTIDGFPSESVPGILNSLDQMPLTYRWHSRFIVMEPQEARNRLERQRKKWAQKVRPLFDQLFQTNSGATDRDALQMVDQTEEAMAEANAGQVVYGSYTSSIILFDEDEEQLYRTAEAVRCVIAAEGFGARIETVNATECYLGSLPGNWYANIRQVMLHTANLADLLPLNSVWPGSPECPCPMYEPGSPPLIQAATTGATPFRLNLHVDDVGHSLIFGPTGSGKSTLLSLIATQFRRYKDAQVFAFDKGRSLLPLTLAMGADHYDVGEGALAFCPLQTLETAEDQAWAAGWLEDLAAMQNIVITPDHRNAISRQISLMAARPNNRSLSDFVAGVQLRDLKDALRPYSVDGPLGQWLDAESDTLNLSAFQCFEIEELMQMGERTIMPVLTYLFRRIEKRLDGRPSLIILDEAWLMLSHATFREKIREWLKTLRKANCAVILATQSISDAASSGILDVLAESCPTKILLPNPAAREPDMATFYSRLGLNEQEVALIAEARPKRDYYATSPDGKRLFDMQLGPITLAFTGASSKEDIKAVRELYHQHGANWPQAWLKARGVAHA